MDDMIKDAKALIAERPLSRRAFAQGGLLTAGICAAIKPAHSMIVTNTEGLVAGEVAVQTDDVAIPAYRAKPQGPGPFPTVLVVQEVLGLHAYIQDVVRRFAKAGFYAIAPEMYFRQGDTTQLTDFGEIFRIVGQVPDAQVMRDLDYASAFASQEGGDLDRLGVTGFCWGGRVTWLYAAHRPSLKAGVAWYGRLVGEPSEMTPAHPVDLAPRIRQPVLGLYGEADQGIPVSTVEAMRAALRAAGNVASQIHVYPDGNHGFHADYRDAFQEDYAIDGWERCLAWFRQNGVG